MLEKGGEKAKVVGPKRNSAAESSFAALQKDRRTTKRTPKKETHHVLRLKVWIRTCIATLASYTYQRDNFEFASRLFFCHFALLPYMQVGEIKKGTLPDTRTQASFFTPQ